MVAAAEAPDIAAVAALIGDRARAAMLTALMAGRGFSAGELARAAGVTKQTASAHITRLVEGGLAVVEPSGRHRYVRLAGAEVGRAIEQLMRLAGRTGATRPAPGPAEAGLRQARVCYDHLAGAFGVELYDALLGQGLIKPRDRELALSPLGERRFAVVGVDVAALRGVRRPLCLACLDWTERRHHLAGALGAALLQRSFDLGWARRVRQSRVVLFSAVGERALRRHLAARG